MQAKLHFNKPFFIAFLGGFFLMLTVSLFINFLQTKQKVSPLANKDLPIESPQIIALSGDPFNILLLGYGGRDHEGSLLTDVMIVLHINPPKKQAAFISVPRDTFVPLPTNGDQVTFHKINAAYSIGGNDRSYPNKKTEYQGETGRGALAKNAVQLVTGLPIDNYIAVDFVGLKKAINHLGGIDIDVPHTFTDNFYPIKGRELELCGKSPTEMQEIHAKYSGFELEKQFDCRYEKLHFEKGPAHIDGDTALKFVRSRHSNEYGGDFARSQRQYAVLMGLKDKIVSLKIFSAAHPLYQDMIETVVSDITAETATQLLSRIGNITDYTVKRINLSTENVFVNGNGPGGQFILIPKERQNNWNGVHEFLKNELEST